MLIQIIMNYNFIPIRLLIIKKHNLEELSAPTSMFTEEMFTIANTQDT